MSGLVRLAAEEEIRLWVVKITSSGEGNDFCGKSGGQKHSFVVLGPRVSGRGTTNP